MSLSIFIRLTFFYENFKIFFIEYDIVSPDIHKLTKPKESCLAYEAHSHGLIGSFLQTGFDSVRFTALLSAIKSGDLRGSLKPGML